MGRIALALAWLIALTCATPARADSIADFYKGRTITLIVGYSVGGNYDVYGRLLARYLGKYIPGEPTVVTQNMPGAGSLKSALFLYNAAPKDGTVIATFSRSISVGPLFDPNSGFDGTKFTWLGSLASDVSVCVVWHTSPVKRFADLQTTPTTFGGIGMDADTDVFALAMKNILDAKVKLVTGYPGTNDVSLAMERGEVEGICGISYSTVRARHPDWLPDKIRILVQAALSPDPNLPDVPLILDLAKTDRQRQMLKLIFGPQQIARPFAAPPGIPEERRAALRHAFDQAAQDKDLLTEAQKLDIDITPISGSGIDRLLAELYAAPKEIAAEAAAATSSK